MSSMILTNEDFQDLRRYVHDVCGLVLGDDKTYLVEQRFRPLLELRSFKSYAELRHALRGPEAAFWRETVINAITTNETSFFRDGHPFDLFYHHVLPRLGQALRQRRAEGKHTQADLARVWCAASSSGQEPYSIAMLIAEYCARNVGAGFATNDFRVLGTDISPRVLERAKTGVYHDLDIARGISEERRARHFEALPNGWRIRPELRQIVSFARVNLMEPFSHLGLFDVVFCRNVLIYFDAGAKQMILSSIARSLRPDGDLFVGAAESLYGVTGDFEPVELQNSVVYRHAPSRSAAGE
jgi:chemotaxis protein methyltransferase CheR